jgi:hypothetical protein
VLVFDPGEIYDFEYTPAGREELALQFGPVPPPPGPPPPPDAPALPPTVSVTDRVR